MTIYVYLSSPINFQGNYLIIFTNIPYIEHICTCHTHTYTHTHTHTHLLVHIYSHTTHVPTHTSTYLHTQYPYTHTHTHLWNIIYTLILNPITTIIPFMKYTYYSTVFPILIGPIQKPINKPPHHYYPHVGAYYPMTASMPNPIKTPWYNLYMYSHCVNHTKFHTNPSPPPLPPYKYIPC